MNRPPTQFTKVPPTTPEYPISQLCNAATHLHPTPPKPTMTRRSLLTLAVALLAARTAFAGWREEAKKLQQEEEMRREARKASKDAEKIENNVNRKFGKDKKKEAARKDITGGAKKKEQVSENDKEREALRKEMIEAAKKKEQESDSEEDWVDHSDIEE